MPGTSAVKDKEHQASIWVGLDGDGLRSSSLPQLGTTIIAKPGQKPECLAWHQWWMRKDRRLPVTLEDFSVEIGDRVTCGLRIDPQSGARAGGLLFEEPQEKSADIDPVARRPGPAEGSSVTGAPAEGLSAEWIMERPTNPENDELFPMAPVDAVEFDGCEAVMRTSPELKVGEKRTLQNSRLIRLRKTELGPQRSVIIARPVKDGSGILRIGRSAAVAGMRTRWGAWPPSRLAGRQCPSPCGSGAPWRCADCSRASFASSWYEWLGTYSMAQSVILGVNSTQQFHSESIQNRGGDHATADRTGSSLEARKPG